MNPNGPCCFQYFFFFRKEGCRKKFLLPYFGVYKITVTDLIIEKKEEEEKSL
jgi:hypothetical protein